LPRPDVCNAYPGRQGCPNVGWSYSLDTTLTPDGAHTLTVTANGATTKSVSRKIIVANGNSVIPKVKLYIDQPNGNSPVLQGLVRVSGWMIGTDPNIRYQPYVYVEADGVSILTLQPTYDARPDVCAVYTTALNCPYVGWTGTLDTTALSDWPAYDPGDLSLLCE
ncbi:MAG TPA: hypothetical protein VK493_00370, partial [Bryobacteraceae bacterium]|nr:hypothetical protein [Bryobacteraceae bacterium]